VLKWLKDWVVTTEEQVKIVISVVKAGKRGVGREWGIAIFEVKLAE